MLNSLLMDLPTWKSILNAPRVFFILAKESTGAHRQWNILSLCQTSSMWAKVFSHWGPKCGFLQLPFTALSVPSKLSYLQLSLHWLAAGTSAAFYSLFIPRITPVSNTAVILPSRNKGYYWKSIHLRKFSFLVVWTKHPGVTKVAILSKRGDKNKFSD
jgi:hypothetical protein